MIYFFNSVTNYYVENKFVASLLWLKIKATKDISTSISKIKIIS